MQGTLGLPGQANLVSLLLVVARYLGPGQVPCLSWLSHIPSPDVTSKVQTLLFCWVFFPPVYVVGTGQKRTILAF